MGLNPIHQEAGRWYFASEDWRTRHGPYASYWDCYRHWSKTYAQTQPVLEVRAAAWTGHSPEHRFQIGKVKEVGKRRVWLALNYLVFSPLILAIFVMGLFNGPARQTSQDIVSDWFRVWNCDYQP